MRAIPKYDDELVSVTSEATEQQKGLSWRRPVVVGVCATLAVAATVGMSRMTTGVHNVTQDGVISLAATAGCAGSWGGCLASGCCQEAGQTCYLKNQWWAQCKPTCDSTWVDPHDNLTWDCTVKNATSDLKCAKDTEDCRVAGNECCNKDFACYIKHGTWANCNADCVQGVGTNSYDPDGKESWSCEIHDMVCPNITNPNTTTPKDLLDCCQTQYCDGARCTGPKVNKCTFYEKQVAAGVFTAV